MEPNITNQQYFSTDLQLSEPHFDDEATVLSARRVVPLGDANVKTPPGKRLAFGLAMALAVLAGVLGASVFYYRGQKQAPSTVETAALPESKDAHGELLSGAAGVMSDSNEKAAAKGVADLARPGAQNDDATTETRKPLSVLSKSVRTKETPPEETDDQLDERELRRAERIEERRLRRIAEREARRETRWHKHQSDDLLRIREIFEGTRRP
jgi:hypothetical protein